MAKGYLLPPHVRKYKLFRILLLFFSLHSLIPAAASFSGMGSPWLGGPDAVGAAVLSPEQRDCCKKGLLLSVPAAQVLICSDVYVLGFASKLCDP